MSSELLYYYEKLLIFILNAMSVCIFPVVLLEYTDTTDRLFSDAPLRAAGEPLNRRVLNFCLPLRHFGESLSITGKHFGQSGHCFCILSS